MTRKLSPSLPLLLLLASLVGCARAESHDRPEAGPRAFSPLHDLVYVVQGYSSTAERGRWWAEHEAARRYEVPRDLPEVAFEQIASSMLGSGESPVVREELRALDGERVRIHGWSLGLPEAHGADHFVLHDEPLIHCNHVEPPATNHQVLVQLAEGTTYEFYDGPLWVEGTLRLGRFETFQGGDLALFRLEDARYEELPPEKMVLPVFRDEHDHKHGPEIHLRPGVH